MAYSLLKTGNYFHSVKLDHFPKLRLIFNTSLDELASCIDCGKSSQITFQDSRLVVGPKYGTHIMVVWQFSQLRSYLRIEGFIYVPIPQGFAAVVWSIDLGLSSVAFGLICGHYPSSWSMDLGSCGVYPAMRVLCTFVHVTTLVHIRLLCILESILSI